MARRILTVQQGVPDFPFTLGTLSAPLAGGQAFQETVANPPGAPYVGMSIQPRKMAKLVLLIYNSAGVSVTVTIAAGVSSQAFASGQGPLAYLLPSLQLSLILGLTAARFDSGGQVFLDTDANATGDIWAYEMKAV